VTARAPLIGGIIAAGEGSRLRRDGFAMPKPLVPIIGVPLIESAVGNFQLADIAPVVIIVNERERDCVDRVRARFPDLATEFIVRTTASSLESFCAVMGAGAPGRMLISTVDAWCRPADFSAFARTAAMRPPDAVVLAGTPLVADEKPLWVEVESSGRVTALGGETGRCVTAGLYLLPERVRAMTPPQGLGRLRDFLIWMHRSGYPMYAEVIDRVVDVDRAEDVALAEALAHQGTTPFTGGVE